MKGKITITNKKARFEYEILDKYNAGIVLSGTEIKSIRLGKASISESFCEFNETIELFVVNMNIETYTFSTNFNHFPKSTRKLLLNKKELQKLNKSVKNTGLTIIPLKLYTNEKGIAKLEIALAKGKKLYDKRQTMIDRDNKRNLDRVKKENKS
tara:strand:- start:1789 stop:2250 length:462 start_codon:yes stop_codon:yes gene_type:complete